MGKRIPEHDKDADTKILYKKSYSSIYTHSRTCSGTSQQTKSTTFSRRKLPNSKVFTDGQTIKKDLSIETDICVLRRYYKYKRNWTSAKAATSAKSRYSNYTEIDTIAEFRDSSACGDKLLGEDMGNLRPPTNMDRTDMLLENFKDLLNEWIRKHLIQDKDTKGKIEDVFEAVFEGVELNRARKSSSCTTYIWSKEDETGNKKMQVNVAASTDYNGQCCISRHPNIPSYENFEQSRYTVPILCKNLRIISTLSIPRNINRRKRYNRRSKLRRIKVNRTPNKNVLVSYMNTPPKFLATVSSFNLLAISTKSLIKHCVNFDDNRFKDIDKNQQQHLILFSEPSNKSATASAISIEEVKYTDLKKLKMHFNDKYRLPKSKSLLEKMSQRKNEKPARKEIDHSNNTDTVTYSSKNENTDTFNNTAKFKITNTYKNTDTFKNTDPLKNASPVKNTNLQTNTDPLKKTNPLKSTNPHKNTNTFLSTDAFKDTKYAIFKANAQISSILNKREHSEPLVSIDLLNQTLEYQREGKINRFKREENKNVKKPKNKRHDRSLSIIRKYERKKRHNFTYLYKRVNSKTFERDKLVRNLEDIIKYITNLNGGENIKFEVHFVLGSGNVGKNEELLSMENSSKLVQKQTMESKYSKPINDTQKRTMVFTANQAPSTVNKIFLAMNKKSTGCMCDQKISIISSRTELEKEFFEIGCMCDKRISEISAHTELGKEIIPEIIPILDGAASQTKYMVSTHSIPKDNAMESIQELQQENMKENAKDKDYKVQQTSKQAVPIIDFNLKQEIEELRTAIRDLASTTEKLLKEHYQTKVLSADAKINCDTIIESKKGSSLNLNSTLPNHSDSVELETAGSKKYSSINATINNSVENRSNSKRLSSGDVTTNSLDRTDSKEENEVRVIQYITNASLIKDQTIKATQYSTKIPLPKYYKCDNIQVVTGNKHDKGLQNSSQKVTIDQSQEQKKRMTSALKKHSASYRVIESESVIKVTNMTSNSSDSKQQVYCDKALTCSLPKSRSLFEFSMDFTNRDILAYFCDNIKTPLRSAFTYVTPAISPLSRSRSESRRGNVINIEEGQISKTSNEESDQHKSSGSTIFEETYSPDASKQVKFRTMGVNEGVLLCTIIFVPVIIIIVLLYEFVLKEKNSSPPKNDLDPNLYLKLSDLGF